MQQYFSDSKPLMRLYADLVPVEARAVIERPAEADANFAAPSVQAVRNALLTEASLDRPLLPKLKAISETSLRFLAATEDMTPRERFAGFVTMCLEAYADRSHRNHRADAGFELERLLPAGDVVLARQLALASAAEGCVESRHAVLFESWQAYAHCSPATLHLWTRHVLSHRFSGAAAKAAILYAVGTFGFTDEVTALACMNDEYLLQAELGEPARDVVLCEAALALIRGAELDLHAQRPSQLDWMKRLRRASRLVAYGRRFN